MRIATVTMQQQGVNAILDKQVKLTNTELQLATGRRILRPSDDPANSSLILNLKQSIGVSEQHIRNSEMALTSLAFAETTTESIVNNLQRVRELTVQGLSDTNDTQNRAALAMEMRQIREAIGVQANTRDAQGEYIFAGSNTTTQPFDVGTGENFREGTFTYSGNDDTKQVQIGVGQRLTVRDPGTDIFGDFSGGENIFKTLDTIADEFESGTITSTDLLDNLDAGLERVLTAGAKIGARINMVERHTEVEESFIVKMKETLADVNDLDYAQTIAQFNLDRVGMEAAQQAYIKIQGLSLFDHLR